jgi:hypothetical protein
VADAGRGDLLDETELRSSLGLNCLCLGLNYLCSNFDEHPDLCPNSALYLLTTAHVASSFLSLSYLQLQILNFGLLYRRINPLDPNHLDQTWTKLPIG